jgi:hypothetical protein
MIVDSLFALLGFKIEGEQDLKKFQSGLDKLEKSCYNVGRGISLMAAAASAAAVAGIGFLAKNVISVNAEFEKFEATLETIEGSSAKAKQSMNWVADFAKRTPYDLKTVTDAFVKMRAYGLDPVNGQLEIIGNVASGMNKSLEQMVEAWADAGRFQFTRLEEATGMNVTQDAKSVTFAYVENGKKISKTVNKTSEDVLKFLDETLGRKFNGGMIRQAKTWSGMMSNLSDAWSDFMRRIGNAGFFDTVKRRLADVLETLDRWTEDGTIERAATFMSDMFTKIADSVAVVMDRIKTHVGYLNENWPKMEPYVKAIAVVFGLLAAALLPNVARFLILAGIVDEFLSWLEKGDSVIGRFEQWLRDLIPASDEVKDALARLGVYISGGLLAAFVIAPATMVGIVLKIVTAFSETFITLLGKSFLLLASRIVPLFVGLFASLSNPVGWAVILAGVAAALVTYFWDDLKKEWDKISFTDLGARAMESIVDGMKKKWQDAKDGLSKMFDSWPFGGLSGSINGGGGSDSLRGGDSQGIRARAGRSSAGYQGRVPLNSAEAAELRESIIRESARIGADPEDLATLVSFETAGTFNKAKRGPVTKHGRHIGFIQMGEPQRRQFGVDPDRDSISEQMRKAGDYFIANGYRPGMTGAQLYSTVNTGSPYTGHRSDTKAGGTWGSSDDKWNYQMRGHRANARRLLSVPTNPAVVPGTPEAANFRQMMQNYDENRRKLDATRQSIGPMSSNQNVTVTAPVTVNVQKPTDAPRAVGEAVQGAVNKVKPSRMQASPAS